MHQVLGAQRPKPIQLEFKTEELISCCKELNTEDLNNEMWSFFSGNKQGRHPFAVIGASKDKEQSSLFSHKTESKMVAKGRVERNLEFSVEKIAPQSEVEASCSQGSIPEFFSEVFEAQVAEEFLSLDKEVSAVRKTYKGIQFKNRFRGHSGCF